MPTNAPAVKQAAVAGYGARIVSCDITARESTADQVAKDTGAAFIHPSNDPRVICGQVRVAVRVTVR